MLPTALAVSPTAAQPCASQQPQRPAASLTHTEPWVEEVLKQTARLHLCISVGFLWAQRIEHPGPVH